MLAQRYEVREADGARACPVEHRRHQGARLRDKSEPTRQRIGGRKAGVQADVRAQQADAVGPQDAQQMRPGSSQHGTLLRRVHAGRQYHGRSGAELAQFGDQARHCAGRRADDGQLGHGGQIGCPRVDRLATELTVLRVDGIDRALERRCMQLGPHRGTHAGGPLRRTEDGHRRRIEQVIEVTNAHGRLANRGG